MPTLDTMDEKMIDATLSGKKRDKTTPVREKTRTTRSSSSGRQESGGKGTDGTTVPPSILRKPSVDPKSPAKKKTKGSRGRSKDKQSTGGTEPKGRGRSKTQSVDTASSRKRSQTPSGRKKTPPKEKKSATYADKAKETPKATPKKVKRLKHKKFVQGTIACGKSSTFRNDVYRKISSMVTILQSAQGAKNCRILNYEDYDESPLMNPSQVPKLHADMRKLFEFPIKNSAWNGNTIPVGKTRKIPFACLLEADIPIEELVDLVQIDLIDLQITLEVKKCQAISHEHLLHFVRISNKFNRTMFEHELLKQLKEFQAAQHEWDPESYLGKKEAAKKKIPDINIKLDYPFNGPWEKTKDGTDTRYKRTFVAEYSTKDKIYVETLLSAFKSSGLLAAYWGEHANFHFAPPKDDEDRDSFTKKQKWAKICDSHSCTMLSSGAVMLEEVKNPDYKVDVTFWKASKANKQVRMSLRDVLHSVRVPGADGREAQVIHGLCPAPEGGYEAGTASSVPLAHATAKNIAAHPAGWVNGYLQMKGWSKASIALLLRQSFTTSAVVSAQNSTWDRKTGIVKSDRMDETERELQAVANSWVDMSLLNKVQNEVEDSELKDGDMVAFDWAEGGSIKTMTSNKSGENSDAEVIDSSDSENGSYCSEEGSQSENEMEQDSDGGNSEMQAESSEEYEGEEESMGPRDLNEEEMWKDMAAMEDPVMDLFPDEEERQAIWDTIMEGEINAKVIQMAMDITSRKDRMVELDLEMAGLFSEDGTEGEEYQTMYTAMEEEYEALKLLVRATEVRLRDALRKMLTEKEANTDDESAQVKNSVGFKDPQDTGDPPEVDEDKQVEESMQHDAQSNDAGRSSG